MTTSIELAAKLKATMEESGVSIPELAAACGVKVPSVYDWLEHGRVAKKHLPTFSRIFGKPLGYWLDDESEDDLAPDERQLLAMYRALSEDFKNRLIKDAEHLRELEKPADDQNEAPPPPPAKAAAA